MKTRDYSLYKKVTDAEGHDHFITVVGRLVLSKEDTTVTLPAIVETENGKTINGTILHPLKRNRRELTMAYSICHPMMNSTRKRERRLPCIDSRQIQLAQCHHTM